MLFLFKNSKINNNSNCKILLPNIKVSFEISSSKRFCKKCSDWPSDLAAAVWPGIWKKERKSLHCKKKEKKEEFYWILNFFTRLLKCQSSARVGLLIILYVMVENKFPVFFLPHEENSENKVGCCKLQAHGI